MHRCAILWGLRLNVLAHVSLKAQDKKSSLFDTKLNNLLHILNLIRRIFHSKYFIAVHNLILYFVSLQI